MHVAGLHPVYSGIRDFDQQNQVVWKVLKRKASIRVESCSGSNDREYVCIGSGGLAEATREAIELVRLTGSALVCGVVPRQGQLDPCCLCRMFRKEWQNRYPPTMERPLLFVQRRRGGHPAVDCRIIGKGGSHAKEV
jgi:hypothetical protein